MFQAATLIPACCDVDSPALVLDALAGVSDMTEFESMICDKKKKKKKNYRYLTNKEYIGGLLSVASQGIG